MTTASRTCGRGELPQRLGVPDRPRNKVIGAIFVGRATPGLFTDAQVALLQTFADQAVIAIENVRLFTELEARNNALTEALEQQTATSEILRVISSSPTDVQPVFDTIAAARREAVRRRRSNVFRASTETLIDWRRSSGTAIPAGIAAIRADVSAGRRAASPLRRRAVAARR